MQNILNKSTMVEVGALEGEMLIVNQNKEELFLEIRFSKKNNLFGKECYSFIC
jgi:hypothetical protein